MMEDCAHAPDGMARSRNDRACMTAEPPEQRCASASEAEYRSRLRHNTKIPSMPAVALKAIEIGNDPESGIADIVAVIRNDIGLTAKILMAANSPVYGLRRKVANLNQAASMLGLDACMVLILSFSLAGAVRQKGIETIEHQGFWQRSLSCAVAGKALAGHAGIVNCEKVFLASLLQDVGIIAFDRLAHARYAPAYESASGHAMLVKLEKVLFGLDHARVGGWLLAEWSFPEWITSAVGASHGDSADKLQQCVSSASEFAEVFTGADKEEAIGKACETAQDMLGMDPDTCIAVLDEMQTAMPGYAAMFDVDTPCSDMDLVEQARQTLMLRSMRLCTDILHTREKAAEYEVQLRCLENKAYRDGLTGAFNRAYLDHYLPEAFADAGARSDPLSIAFIDLDHFKQINDRYGHQFGDTVLKGTCAYLMGDLRKQDVLARYGGEEFVLVMPGVDARAAFSIMERLLSGFRRMDFINDEGRQVPVSFSAGVATHMDLKRFDSVRSLLRAADDALYIAKDGGRNRVVLHEPG